jgi:hypothetical protein
MATNINYDGVPTATDMEATLLPDPEQMFAFRNAFRVDEQAPNRDGDSVEYPALDGDFEGELVEIGKDEEHPEAKLTYDGLQAAWTEYGFKFRIRDKDVKDSKINLVAVNQQEATREEMRRLDGIAGTVIENNRNSVEIGTDGNAFNYDAAVDMETELIDAGYDSGRFMWFLSPRAWGSLAKSTDFKSDTEEFANELRSEGIRHGELLGYPALRTNTGQLGQDDAYLVDTGVYGWESPRDEFDVNRWRDDDERCWFYGLNGRIDWVPTEPDAAIKAVGGV